MASPVKLFVYDVTRGMARTLAPMLLGIQLDGVYHTGVSAFGNEYFFGSGGITYCQPGDTILGHPDEIVDMGLTEIPQDLFHEYLAELSDSSFKGTSYHLLDHNCNNFSNEICQFLTGQTIPTKITGLPAEVLNTPLGQMMRPFIDSMMTQINSGTHIEASAAAGQLPPASQSAPLPAKKDGKPKESDLD